MSNEVLQPRFLLLTNDNIDLIITGNFKVQAVKRSENMSSYLNTFFNYVPMGNLNINNHPFVPLNIPMYGGLQPITGDFLLNQLRDFQNFTFHPYVGGHHSAIYTAKEGTSHNCNLSEIEYNNLEKQSNFRIWNCGIKIGEAPRTPKETICAICLESPFAKNPNVTKCGHVFCKDCIFVSLKSKKKCPVCKKSCTIRAVHQLFL